MTPIPPPTVEKRHERWPSDDIRRLMRAGRYCESRKVAWVLVCLLCGERLAAIAADGAGNTLVECACVARVWER